MEQKQKEKIILDCDPGHDDAITIMVAGLHKKFDLLGITVVAGNQTYEKVTKNALKICDFLNLNVNVHGGMKGPLIREQIVAPDFHGESGLDGIILPNTNKQLGEEHAVNFIINTLLTSDEKITLVPVGPLTNIAMALKLEPKIKEKIDKIVLMGGSCKGGNVTSFAEFNIYADPEAAYIVFNAQVPIYMMGLEITNKTMPNIEIVEKIKSFNTKASEILYQGLHYPKRYDKNGNIIYNTLHDVVTLAYLIDNSLVKLEKIACKIEIKNEEQYGRTICSGIQCNCNDDENVDENRDYIVNNNIDYTKDFSNKELEYMLENSEIYTGVEIDLNKFWEIIFDVIK